MNKYLKDNFTEDMANRVAKQFVKFIKEDKEFGLFYLQDVGEKFGFETEQMNMILDYMSLYLLPEIRSNYAFNVVEQYELTEPMQHIELYIRGTSYLDELL